VTAGTGKLVIFVDADTVLTPRVPRAALRVLHGGAVRGGCSVRIDGRLPLYALLLERLPQEASPWIGLAGGCFLFCKRQAYLREGGFNETLARRSKVAQEVEFGAGWSY